MSWQAFQLTFKLESSLHSGYEKMGNIQRTHLYVTGRMLWGSLTSVITLLLGSSDYARVGEMVKKHLRTSYLFPCLDEEGQQLILPQMRDYQKSYLVKGKDINGHMIDRSLITSYSSTAIDAKRQAAEDGSLHEVELLSHRFLCDVNECGITVKAGDQVYLSGVLFLADNAPEDLKCCWKPALEHLQVGGERGYGFGLLKLLNEPCPTKFLFGYQLTLSTKAPDPEVKVDKNKPLPAHAIVEDALDLEGAIEPYLGRETLSNGRFGKKLSKAEVCWVPGAVSRQTISFHIGEKGLWFK